MIQLILAVVVLVLLLVGVIAVALSHFWGWKGLVAFPFILIVLVWLGKVAIGKLFKRLALGLFSMKSSALRGATVTVHSVKPVPKPVENVVGEDEDEEDEDEHAMEHEDEEEEGEDEDEAEEKPREYFAVEITIEPDKKAEGRVWEPGEFILASEKIKSLGDLEEKEIGSVEEVLVWNGCEFGPDDECKYPGTQRLRVTFAVKPGTTKAWLQYYNESLISLDLPRWEVSATT